MLRPTDCSPRLARFGGGLNLTRPVPLELIDECIEIALQAPTASNQQHWRFLVVTDPEIKTPLADIYRRAMTEYMKRPPTEYAPDDPRAISRERALAAGSAPALFEHLHEVPVHVIPCVEGRPEGAPPEVLAALYGSILPAAWSFMLAARSRGLGMALTTLHLMYELEAAELLGVPSTHSMVALFPVAYYTGDDFRPAPRLPASDVTFHNQWGQSAP